VKLIGLLRRLILLLAASVMLSSAQFTEEGIKLIPLHFRKEGNDDLPPLETP